MKNKIIMDKNNDKFLVGMSLGELSDFYVRGMQSSSEQVCHNINILLQNGDETDINH